MVTPALRERLRASLRADIPVASSSLPQAAVLVLLDLLASEPQVVLTRRADHLRMHAGEVAFPGGRCDDSDEDHWHTALREAEEEIALPVSGVARLGVMAPLITRTGIQVTPCVGELRRSIRFTGNPDEIDSVFRVPLSFLSDRKNLQFDALEYAGASRRVPRYHWREFRIWGVTAAMLVMLVNRACDAGLDLEDYFEGLEQ